MIKVKMSPNEKLSDRIDFMSNALLYFKKGEFSDVITEDIPCDILFEEDGERFAVEIKTVKDYYSSRDSTRLCSQLLRFIEDGDPCSILILGSFDDVMANVPDFADHGRRFKRDIEMDNMRSQNILAECFGVYVPVLFLSNNPITSFIFLLRVAMQVLRGGSVVNIMPKPDKSARKKAMLCMIKGVGEKTANAIIHEYGTLYDLAEDIKRDTKRLTGVKVGKRCISENIAHNIAEVFTD